MLGFFIGLLTVVLVLDCLFLILLVLVQLPKKEAGMGQAFGGAATDALFGAGSGNALTKLTKWAAAFFFVLAIALTVMSNVASTRRGGPRLQEMMQKTGPTPPPPMTVPAGEGTPAPAPAPTINLDATPSPQGVTPPPPANTPPAGNP